ncbi:hypothetical protein M2338_002911 [Sphingobium sp. B2D3B]|uniref:hypothetical protein n=1 Tax=Sphingobium sp. B2D3B TaxID=2940580 RepID=UPI0022247D56|nr:hypothetical protein [Sphingobium sp. B2D3B]MCW2383346.1 hypothetical protein [Sphingobium sp. B2D3B]
MTKRREPLSFAAAVNTVGSLVGWAQLAQILGKSERLIRYWSDEDHRAQPSLEQAMALDRAYLAAGGNHAPVLEAYADQLDLHAWTSSPCQAGLASDISTATRETAEAISISITLIQPGATLPDMRSAQREVNEGIDALNRVRARLNSMIVQDGGAKQRGSRAGRLCA